MIYFYFFFFFFLVGEGLRNDEELFLEHTVVFSGYTEKIDELQREIQIKND